MCCAGAVAQAPAPRSRRRHRLGRAAARSSPRRGRAGEPGVRTAGSPACRVSTTGTTGSPASTAQAKAPMRNGISPGARRKVPSAKNSGERPSLAAAATAPVVLQALPAVEALDEAGADPLERQTRQPGAAQFRLGDEGDRARQRRRPARGRRGSWRGSPPARRAARRGNRGRRPAAASRWRGTAAATRHGSHPTATASRGSSRTASHDGGTSSARASQDQPANSTPRAVRRARRLRPMAVASASLNRVRQAGGAASPMRPARQTSRLACRRILPLEVRGMVFGGASTTSSGGPPTSSATSPLISARRVSSRTASRLRVSAMTISRSLPLPALGVAERRHPTRQQPRQSADGCLDVGRMDIAAAADDQVFRPRGDIDVVVGDVGEVAGLPPVAGEQPPRRRVVAPVAARRRRPAKLQSAFPPLRQLKPRSIDDADIVAGQRAAAGDEGNRPALLGVAADRPAGAAQQRRDRCDR